MAALDRRTFLRTAGRMAVGVAAVDAGQAPADSPPPPKGLDAALKALDGDGTMAVPTGAVRRLGDQRMRIVGTVRALQFSPRGTTLVSATSGELRGWDPRTGKVLFRLNFPEDASVESGRLTSRDTFLLLVRPHSGNSEGNSDSMRSATGNWSAGRRGSSFRTLSERLIRRTGP